MPSEHVDTADWIRLYRETLTPLYAWVSRRTGGERELAEDVVHETWLRALAAWRSDGFPAEPLGWLRTVARNLVLNHFRDRRPTPVDATEIDLEQPATEAETPRAAALIHWGLARMRTGQARLIEAHHLEGKALAVIASELGVSERAVEGRLRRSRETLRRRLAPFYETTDDREQGNPS